MTVYLLSVICLTVASICQLLIPSVVAKSLSALTTGSINAEFYFTLIAVFLTKLSSQALGSSLATLMEARSRFLLINFIVHDTRPSPLCSRVTLIKEDAEKIASAIHDTIHLIGSCILTVSAAYILLQENIYFFLPIALIIVLTCVQLRFAKPVIQRLYAAEMSKEDLYKESLISAFNVSSDGKQSKMQLIRSYGYLEDTVRARYKYLKASAIQSFWPEMAISAGTVSVIFFSAAATPELFGERLIACLGYIGIFTMASTGSIRLGITMIGVKVSVDRIFRRHRYE
jgi:ABC-type bacteriocin/lantibiotic exporter with double-glycine peptidase domain